MKIPGLTIARLNPLTIELRRIADALEIIVRESYGIRMTAPKVSGTPADERDVLYSSDKEHFKQELLDIYNRERPDRPIGDEEDES